MPGDFLGEVAWWERPAYCKPLAVLIWNLHGPLSCLPSLPGQQDKGGDYTLKKQSSQSPRLSHMNGYCPVSAANLLGRGSC